MLTIKKFASKLGVSVDLIKHYTEVGLISPVTSSSNKYRYFDEEDALVVANARVMRSLDFSLSDVDSFGRTSIEEQQSVLSQRQKAIENEITALSSKLSRLKEIQGYLQKTSLCTGTVYDVHRGPIHSIYSFGKNKESPEAEARMAEWVKHFPYTHISIKLPKEELNNPDFEGPYSTEIGYGVIWQYAEKTGLDLSPPVETIPAGRFLIFYFTAEDLFNLTPEDLNPLLEKAKALNVRFLNNSSGRLLAIEEKPDGSNLYYCLVRIRIG